MPLDYLSYFALVLRGIHRNVCYQSAILVSLAVLFSLQDGTGNHALMCSVRMVMKIIPRALKKL